MKKYIKLASIYAVAAMIGGVFYREFTKWNTFSENTMLGKIHTHLFVLGMIVFLLVAIFTRLTAVEKEKPFRWFMLTYNIGLPLTVALMVARGVTEVKGIALSRGLDAAISGMAGIGHLLIGAGIVLLLVALYKAAKKAPQPA
jgi:hypothetical protein